MEPAGEGRLWIEDQGDDPRSSSSQAADSEGLRPAESGDQPPRRYAEQAQAERTVDIQEDRERGAGPRRADEQGLLERARRAQEDDEDRHPVKDSAGADHDE